jgi:hypothetical protein
MIRLDRPVADDDLIDLLKTPKSIEANSDGRDTQQGRSDAFDPELIASWNSSRREYPNVLFITFAGLALICVVISVLRNLPGGTKSLQ